MSLLVSTLEWTLSLCALCLAVQARSPFTKLLLWSAKRRNNNRISLWPTNSTSRSKVAPQISCRKSGSRTRTSRRPTKWSGVQPSPTSSCGTTSLALPTLRYNWLKSLPLADQPQAPTTSWSTTSIWTKCTWSSWPTRMTHTFSNKLFHKLLAPSRTSSKVLCCKVLAKWLKRPPLWWTSIPVITSTTRNSQ